MASKKDVVKQEPSSICERPSGSSKSWTSSSSSSFDSSSFETESESSSSAFHSASNGKQSTSIPFAKNQLFPRKCNSVQLCENLPFLHVQTVQRILVEDNGCVDWLNEDVVEVSLEHMNTSTIRTLQLFVQNPQGYYAARELVAIDKRISHIEKELGQKYPREDEEIREELNSLSISLCRQHFNMSISNAARALQLEKRLILCVIRAHGYCEWSCGGNKKREERNSSKKESSSETGYIIDGEYRWSKELDDKEISDIMQGVYDGVPAFELPKELKVEPRKRWTDVEVLFKYVEQQVIGHAEETHEISFNYQLLYVKSSGMSMYLHHAIRWLLPHLCHAEIMRVICDEFLPEHECIVVKYDRCDTQWLSESGWIDV